MDRESLIAQEQRAGKRISLAGRIPLLTPFSLQFSPSSFCNFKCVYCWQSLPSDILSRKFSKQHLDFDRFRRAIDGCAGFAETLQMVLFAVPGEPLLHPDIDRMIKYTVQSGVTKRVDLLTNASLLTHETSDRLIDAGLDRLRISLQGMSTEKYKAVCGSSITFEQILDRIGYFYRRRDKTSVYVKVIDCALDEGDISRFNEFFSQISDDHAVEYLSPFVREIDFSSLQKGFHGTFRNGGVPGGSKACPLAFYMIAVQADGSVTPWCTGDIATVYGHIDEKSLPEIWRGDVVRDFQCMQLVDRAQNPTCAQCQVPLYNVREGDCLNGYEEAILARLGYAGQHEVIDH